MMKFSSEVRVAGIFQIDLASIKEPHAAGRTSVPTSTKDPADPSSIQTKQHRFKPIDAQLWQLNQFIQAEGQHQPNTVGVLHARKTKHRDANGKKTERIQLLIRPKVTGFFSAFIDGIKNGAEQKLAAEVVTTLRNAYENETRTPQASCPEYLNSRLKVNIKPAARVDTDALAPWLEEVANAIAENKLGKQGEPVQARQESMRGAVREALNPGSGVVAVGKESALEQLKPYGFKPAQIKAFHKLVADIIDGQAGGGEDVYALETFTRQWLGLCDLTTDGGKKFRQFICDDPCYHTWNLVAHRLAGRTVPKFDLRSHSLCHHVMVPQVADMIWSEAASDNGAAHETVRDLHAKAAQDGTWQLKRGAYFEPTLFAAKSCVIDPEQTELDYEQRCYLDKTYRNIIAERVITGSRFLLTPLFNYTENTIDACVAAMLGPVRLAIEDGKTGLHFDIFSTDPRITKKFNEALATLLAGAKKKVNTVTDYSPSPRAMAYLAHETTAIEPVASMESVATGMTESAGVFFEKLRQQIDGLVQPKLDEDRKSSADASAFARSLPGAGLTSEPSVIAPHALYSSMSAGIKSFTERSVEYSKQQIDMLKNQKGTTSADASLSDYPAASMKLASDDTFTPPKRISTSKKQLSVIASRTRKRQAKSPQVPRKAEIASPASRVDKPAIGAPGAVREIKLQTGITENNWLPNQDTVLMLTRSTAEYVQADQMSVRQEVASILNSEGFSIFEETSTIFRPHDARPGNHLNRYFAPVKEVTLDDSSLPFLARALDIAKPDEIIARTYKDVCENAAAFGIHRLVLTPCFGLPATTQSGNFKAYTKAIAVMVTTLDQLSITSPKLDLTLAARSGAEQVLIQGCMTALKEQKARDALRSL